jgi:NAD-dependent SIR2 family protein deacetylase
VARARALVIGAGAGMGVDSGLPDFRGPEGFWRAYPAYARLGLDFQDLAQPRWFDRDPTLAWGFYGHRLGLYRRTRPHAGFALLAGWAARMPHGAFVLTSNVDGQFQRAGFDETRLLELHGALSWLQCTRCPAPPWLADGVEVDVDDETGRARGPLPSCPGCGATARPNVLLFGDGGWEAGRTEAQEARLGAWLAATADEPMVIVECGAGTAIPSVRLACERLASARGATLVRVNPREPEVPRGQIALAAGALEALRAIDRALPQP